MIEALRRHARLARPLRQVHDLRDRVPVLERHAAVPRAEVRRPAGRALPYGRARARRFARLLLGLRHLHAGLPARREDRRDQHAREARLRERDGIPLRDRIIARPTLVGRLGTPVAPLANWTLRNRASGGSSSRRRHPSRRAHAGVRRPHLPGLGPAPPRRPRRSGGVVYFHGCSTNYYEPRLGEMTVAVLEHNGFRVDRAHVRTAAASRCSRTGCSTTPAGTCVASSASLGRTAGARATTSSATSTSCGAHAEARGERDPRDGGRRHLRHVGRGRTTSASSCSSLHDRGELRTDFGPVD